MKSFLLVLSVYLMVSCTSKQENKQVMSQQIDTVNQVKEVKAAQASDGIVDVYKLLQGNAIQLGDKQSLELPEMKLENGKYNIYDPAFDEPINEAIVSSTNDKMEFVYGDFSVIISQLGPCSNGKNIGVIISNLMGNYTNYSLKIFNLDNENQLTDITQQVISSVDLKKKITIGAEEADVNINDLQYEIDRNLDLKVKINQSKLNPIYAQDKPEDPILKTTQEQRGRDIILGWSAKDCMYLIK